MCKLLIATNNVKNNKKLAAVVKSQFELMKEEKDGIGVLIVGERGGVSIHRKLDSERYDEVLEKVMDKVENCKMVSIHTRMATHGAVDLSNVHFFEHKGWVMAHNGTVLRGRSNYEVAGEGDSNSYWESMADCIGCSTAKKGYCKKHEYPDGDYFSGESCGYQLRGDTGKSDTRQFLIGLKKPENCKYLAERVDDEGLWGMALLFNKKTKESRVIVQKECYSMAEGDRWAMFTSFDPEVEIKRSIITDNFGLPVILDQLKKLPQLAKLLDGTYKLRI